MICSDGKSYLPFLHSPLLLHPSKDLYAWLCLCVCIYIDIFVIPLTHNYVTMWVSLSECVCTPWDNQTHIWTSKCMCVCLHQIEYSAEINCYIYTADQAKHMGEWIRRWENSTRSLKVFQILCARVCFVDHFLLGVRSDCFIFSFSFCFSTKGDFSKYFLFVEVLAHFYFLEATEWK